MNTCIRPQQGLTLVEIMVAMTISLLLMAGIIQIFAGNKQTYRMQEGLARMQENTRFAVDFMSQDIRQAGYVGCIRNIDGVNNGLKNPPASFNPGTGIQGWESVGTAPGDTYALNATSAAPVATTGNDSNWSGWTPAAGDALNTPDVMRGSDILRIWHGDTTTLTVNSITPGQPTIINVEQSNAIGADDFVLISDCVAAEWMQVCSSAGGPVVNGKSTTNLIAADSGCELNNDLSKPPATLAPNGEVIKLVAGTYFVGKRYGSAQNPPSLFRAALKKDGTMEDPQELVEGVDSMQILYGEDTDNNGDVDSYRTANNIADWNNIINVKISLLMRTIEEVDTKTHGGNIDVNGTTINLVANDRRPRKVFTTTIVLRNRTA